MHVLRIAGLFAKTRVEIRHELGRKGVARLDRADAAKAQLLHKSVLQGLVGALDTSFGLGRVGTDDVDVELIERAAELRQAAGPIQLRTMCRAENAVLVAVEGQRLAPVAQIRFGRTKIVERVLRCRKAQMQQLAGRIVDKDEQGAFGTAVLEPPVVRAIDLHQLAEAVAPAARLMELAFALTP